MNKRQKKVIQEKSRILSAGRSRRFEISDLDRNWNDKK